jgi:hypothetical protein
VQVNADGGAGISVRLEPVTGQATISGIMLRRR